MILDLPDYIIDGLRARAESQGMTLEDYIAKVLTSFASDGALPIGGWVEDEAVNV